MTELEISSDELAQQEKNEPVSFESLYNTQLQKGVEIYLKGLFCWHIWLNMAASEIRRRYRRTFLGPFWVTLSVAIFIGTMGVIFPILWHTNIETFLPFFASGFIVWTFISTSITEACGTFLDFSGLIKQVPLPYSIYANVVVARNIIVMLHHLVVYLAIMLLFHVSLNFKMLLFFPAMLILCFTASWLSILFGLVSTRFRDIKQLVASFLQIAMFITPILWMPAQLGTSWKAKALVMLNPLSHFVAIARAPLLGQEASMVNWITALVICIIGWIFTMKILSKYHKHLVFWL